MSTKKEKCCEVCESPNGCITAFIGQNCPCHQSESIEWKDREYEFEVLTSYESPYAGKSSIQHQAYREGASKMFDVLLPHLKQAITTAVEARERVDENTSDGYHTFKELYEFRKVYNAVLFNEWAKQGKYNVHKSLKHSDGEDCFGGGWFIVTATLPSGQISNHYELKDWKLFRVDEHVKADEWDGHTAQDVVARLLSILKH